MEKFTVILVIIVSVFLYFTRDAGFKFETATAEQRVEFVHRQAHRAASGAHFLIASGPNAVFVGRDQRSVRLKIPSDRMANFDQRRADVFRQACAGYLGSYLDEHGVTVQFQFYRKSGAMAGSMKVSPGACAQVGKTGV